jgi:hypothetical protein
MIKTLCSGIASLLALSAAILTGALLTTGCEEAKGTMALTVSPSFVDLSGDLVGGTNGVVQTFTVTAGTRDLSLPLEWRVSNPALGQIAGSGGFSASYQHTGARGDNAILVKDQYGAEGIATVHQ